MTDLLFPLSSRSNSASIRQPRQFTNYSVDINYNQILNSTQELRYFYFPETLLPSRPDLNQGLGSFKERVTPDGGRHLNRLLHSITEYEKIKRKKVKADIITYRGVMTSLLILPYENRSDIDINIVRFDGQLLMEFDHFLLESKRTPPTEEMNRMTYWGYKFEALATLPKPWAQCTREQIESRPTDVVDNITEYISVVRTGVGKTKVVLGGEVDCVLDYLPTQEDEDPLEHYVELKTSKVVLDQKSSSRFEFKLLKSWAQSFLIGVPKIVYGFRDDFGYVKAVEDYETKDIPKIVNSRGNKWNGNECISFYSSLLEWLLSVIPDDENMAWRLCYTAKDSNLKLYRLDSAQEKHVISTLVLEEFSDWRKELRGSS